MLKKLGIYVVVTLLAICIFSRIKELMRVEVVAQGKELNDELVNYSEPSENFKIQFSKGKIFQKINTALKERGLAEKASCSVIGSEQYFMVEAKIEPKVVEDEDLTKIQLVINEILIINGYDADKFNIYIQ
ncbi:hypothetical protein CIB95_09945 [Lottiidibacillus patelloidae]|uniref:Uncharacterized protein n=1 Tax=Lottiidibacillus patelloidae TaxID=2670334 RepID=A0A263BV82_9BACI|nr:hypothetical protein [Lottiidibacillus patelloidae]OZM57076.1 hypothetical protein CIB95_09945 [Lottiidibacillus patelloidae]